jgi:GDP-L-fucose synthase
MNNMSCTPFDLAGKRVFVAGHRGMVGSAVVRRLEQEPCEILTVDRKTLDLTRQRPTELWLHANRPQVVIVAAGCVGGILANNSFPVDFLADNLAIELNVIRASYHGGVEKLLFLGSSCVYPKFAKQPMREEELLTGELEPTNEWYAVAKIAGIKLCQAYRRQFGSDFISVMPTNLYGPGDNYHPQHSHVPAALLRRFHEGKIAAHPSVAVWGTGTARREFLYVDDLADACIHLLKCYSDDQHINIGTGVDISIAEFARAIADTVGYTGSIVFDTSRPDGTPRKLLDTTRLSALGWQARTPLAAGLARTYADFLNGHGRNRSVEPALADAQTSPKRDNNSEPR